MGELKEKHSMGTNEVDDPDRAPTGLSYRHQQQTQIALATKLANEKSQQAMLQRGRDILETQQRRSFVAKQIEDNEDDSDSEYDKLLDDDLTDPVLEALRQRRLEELQQTYVKKAQDVARGHGQFRTISQDEFLPECTGSSEHVAVHFFHSDFDRCKIMDYHLKLIAPIHTECKFIRIDAAKSPFFVAKLQIRTLPSLIVFRDGKAIDRLTGFDGFSNNPKDPDDWETGSLQAWLAGTGAIDYKPPSVDLQEEMKRLGLRSHVYRGGVEHFSEVI
jgi:hypothetical protein